MEDLYKRLERYTASSAYPLHMPGHQRNLLLHPAYKLDITEIDGFDDLHHPEDFLKDAMEEAARLYGSRRTFFMVNGSSGGILAALSALAPVGGKVLLARNCHTSAYNAMVLRQLRPVYVWPRVLPALGGVCGAVLPELCKNIFFCFVDLLIDLRHLTAGKADFPVEGIAVFFPETVSGKKIPVFIEKVAYDGKCAAGFQLNKHSIHKRVGL